MNTCSKRATARIVFVAAGFGLAGLTAATPAAAQMLPTGQMLTPLAAPGAAFEPLVAHTGPLPETLADGAAAIAVSPEGTEMLVLTSGFNRIVGADGKVIPEQSGQYLFRYAIGADGSRLVQTLTVPNAYSGVAWTPDGKSILVGGGESDTVYRFDRGTDGFRASDPIRLGHKEGNGVEVKPQTAGVAVSPDGHRALVANYYNDSVSLIDLSTNIVLVEQDLRPGKIDPARSGVPGGEFPFAVTWIDNTHAVISSPRDRELVQLAIAAKAVSVTGRIATVGEPTALLYDGKTHRLYATEDNADRVAIIDPDAGKLVGELRLRAPGDLAITGKGLNPNGLALAPDGRLLVTLGGINALAFVSPDGKVEGMVPTGWYPSAVATDKSGTRLFVINRKSPPGPNPMGCKPKLASIKSQGTACGKDNQYIYQLEKAGLLTFPLPSAQTLFQTTAQVASNLGVNDQAARAAAAKTMAALRTRIKHVVFIVKENRTYDQVLGDLSVGNGDPSLAILGRRLSPNHHRLAEQFVTLDNFYDSGEQSSTGWTWTTAARVPDTLEKTAPVNYAKRGLAYEAEEAERNIPTAQTMAERRATNPATPNDPDLLPGKALLTAPDADDKDGDGDDDDAKGAGFLWTAAIKAGLSVRNYGFADASVYDDDKAGDVPLVREPFKSKTRIWTPTDRLLATRSDPYFRGFDQRMPDYWRLLEWQREFAGQAKAGKMARLTLLRLSHDHFGNFKTAIDGVNTVETEMADNDYAVGMVMETVAKSPFKDSTLVFMIEDDAQNGADHVDARRSIAFVVGPYVKQKTVVSARYSTVSMVRTIGDLLGLKPISLNAALALPMTEAFDLNQRTWNYHASASDVLKATQLPIPADRFEQGPVAQACTPRDAAFWARVMVGQDFSQEDRLDTAAFNAALWQGLGKGPEPVARTGEDLSTDRGKLLATTAGCH
jgi:DNA-binding beta-propeller fold protein YncE